MRRYAAVLLDVDGTLVDSNDAHAHAWVEALAAHDIEVPYARVRSLIGMGGSLLIAAVGGPEAGTKRNEKIGEERGAIFRDNWLRHVRPLPKVRELVLCLRREGYHLAIATSAKEEELKPLLEVADVADLVPVRTSADDVDLPKPHPDIVEAALARVPAERHRCVMIGDTPYDVMACRGAAVDIIGVTTGGWSAEGLAGSIAIYDGPSGLLARWADSPMAR